MGALRHFLGTLRGGRLAVALLLGFALALLLGRAATAAWAEILWQQSAGHAGVFWRRIAWSWGARIVAGLAVTGVVYANLRVAALTLGGIHIRRRFGNIEISEQLPRSWVSAGILGAAALLGLWFGAAVPTNLGLQMAAALGASAWGVTEPILGRDVGFYVFLLPILVSLVTFGLVVTFLVFTLVTAAYATTGAIRWVRGRLDALELARLHLGALVAVFLLLIAVRLWLGRSLLLIDGHSAVQGIFGFADAQARLPALQTMAIITVVAAATVVWGAWRDRLVPVVAALGSVILGGVVITQLYPSVVQRFQVVPNELARETAYIEHNLAFTRRGFGLDELRRVPFRYAPDEPLSFASAMSGLEGVPIWNRNTLLQTYRAIEARFPYYDFQDVAFGRYEGPSGPEVLAVSVREIDASGIQDPNWQNLHLRDIYIRGMGAVVSRAASRSPESRPDMLVSGLPPEQTAAAEGFQDLGLDRPETYFGSMPQRFALVDPSRAAVGDDSAAAGPPGDTLRPGVDFPDGITLGSPLRRAFLAWRFQDPNLFFASDLTQETRLIYRRSVHERAQAIAPFLRFPEPPHAVIADGRIVWVLEGFTGTRAFPLSRPHEFGALRSQVTYVRNSVKVTIDGVTGATTFYRVPVEDPLLDAYATAFPGLFQPIDAMPGAVRHHIRYARGLLDVQQRVLLQYHQRTAADFHGQQDVWAEAQQQAESTTPTRYMPEYALYRFPGDEEARFNLTTVFVPAGRQNLTGVLAGRTDESGVPELVLLDVAVADQVPGPRQIEALAEQDPTIAQQFSLWRSGGSDVWTGHLHLVPVDGGMLYVEPVFLAAEANAIPELRRFLVSDGRRIAMTEQLVDGVALLAGALEALPVTGPDTGAGGQGGGTGLPTTGVEVWPAEALRMLERADQRIRAGDWEGFGTALQELRDFLQGLQRPGG